MCFQFDSNPVVKRHLLQHNMSDAIMVAVKWAEVSLHRVASRQLEVEHQKAHFVTHNYHWPKHYW